MRFEDRRQAGAELAEAVAALGPKNPIVLALPRGGVPTGYEVAKRLGCPLDVVLVRKLGVPGQPELAMGAIAEGGVLVRNEEMMRMAGVSKRDVDRAVDAETAALARQAEAFRPAESMRLDPAGHTALIVDDGLATGATALAAVDALRQQGASAVWICVPVGPADTSAALEEAADEVVVVYTPRRFGAVGAWYRNFGQVEDDEVKALLEDARLRFGRSSEEEP